MLSLEPHFDVTLLTSTFLLSICTCQMSHKPFITSVHCTGTRVLWWFDFLRAISSSAALKAPFTPWIIPTRMNQVVEHDLSSILWQLWWKNPQDKFRFKVMLFPLQCDAAEMRIQTYCKDVFANTNHQKKKCSGQDSIISENQISQMYLSVMILLIEPDTFNRDKANHRPLVFLC